MAKWKIRRILTPLTSALITFPLQYTGILNFSFCCLLFCAVGNAAAQSQFLLRIGGPDIDLPTSIIQTEDGGYAIAGASTSFGIGGYNMYVVKLTENMELQWSKTFSKAHDAMSIIQTRDGGYAVCGTIFNSPSDGWWDMIIAKLDIDGNIQWSRRVGGDTTDWGFSITQTMDGGLVASGMSLSFGEDNFWRPLLIKLDTSGITLWTKIIEIRNEFPAMSYVTSTTDSGFALAGSTFNSDTVNYYLDALITKFDRGGNLQWAATVGGEFDDAAYYAIETIDSDFVITGAAVGLLGGIDLYIAKLDKKGALEWTKAIGGSFEDRGLSVTQTRDGGYAVLGRTWSFQLQQPAMYVVKLSETGTLQWSRTMWGQSGIPANYSGGIKLASDGGLTVAQEVSGDIYIVKFDSTGNTCAGTLSPPSQSGAWGRMQSVSPAVSAVQPVVSHQTLEIFEGGNITILCSVGIIPGGTPVPSEFQLEQNYPNPFNQLSIINYQLSMTAEVKIMVYDALGRELETLVNQKLNPGRYSIRFDGSGYSSGVYFYSLIINGVMIQTRKMILLK
jgi:hypothetical protein